MKITITKEPKGSYTVRSGDRYQDGLCWDEMLGVIARATLHGEQMERVLHTHAEHSSNPYSSLGEDRRRESSYTALCGISDRIIARANEQFAGNIEARLIYLLAAVQTENAAPLFADEPEPGPPPAESPAAEELPDLLDQRGALRPKGETESPPQAEEIPL